MCSIECSIIQDLFQIKIQNSNLHLITGPVFEWWLNARQPFKWHISSLHLSFSCFLCHFCSTGVCSDYTSSFHLSHRYLFRTFQKREGLQHISSIFLTALGNLNHRYLLKSTRTANGDYYIQTF